MKPLHPDQHKSYNVAEMQETRWGYVHITENTITNNIAERILDVMIIKSVGASKHGTP